MSGKFELQGPRVGLIGDIHGRIDVLIRQINDLVAADGGEPGLVIFQLGDLALHWSDAEEVEQRRIARLAEALVLAGATLLVIPGNHESWTKLGRIPASAEDGIQWVTESKRFGYLPAGWRANCGTRTIAVLGGASSPDFDRRTENVDWWPAEKITDSDVDALAAGGFCDILLTHDAPITAALTAATAGSEGFSPEGIAYARAGQQQLHLAFSSVAAPLVVSGHWHRAIDATETHTDLNGKPFTSRNVILDMEGAPRSAALLDLPTLGLEFIENSGRRLKDVSREFRAERRAAGLSSEEVASLLGISESAVSAIESGHLEVGEWVLDRLREA